jgi:hypothetical protein
MPLTRLTSKGWMQTPSLNIWLDRMISLPMTDLLGSVLELCDNIDDSASADEYADVTAMLLDSLADPANQPPAAEQPACALPGKGTGRGRGGYTHGVRGGKRNMDRASIHEKLQ